MRRLRRGLFRLGGFTGAVAVGAALTFVSFPLLISIVGPVDWGSIAVGTSVGSLTAIALSWGWSISGPTRIAKAPESERLELFRRGFSERLLLLIPSLAVAIGASALVSPASVSYTVLSAVGSTLSGLSAAWYFVGAGSPSAYLVGDVVPRSLCVLAGLLLMVLLRDAYVYLWAQVVGYIVAGLVSTYRVCGQAVPWSGPVAARVRSLRGNMFPFATEAAAGVYTLGPAVIVAIVRPELVPMFSAIDRVQRLVLLGTQPFYQVLQGWVPAKHDGTDVRERYRAGLWFTLAASVFVGICVSALLRPVVQLLSGNAIVLPPFAGPLVGVAVAAVMMSRYTGLVWLMSLGGRRSVFASTVVGALVGVAVVALGVARWGLPGALAAVVVAELVVLLFQARLVRAAPVSRYPAADGL